MERLMRYALQWHCQQMAAPWRSELQATATEGDLAEERAKTEAASVLEAASRVASLDHTRDSHAPKLNALVAEATARRLRGERQLLRKQLQDLRDRLEDSEQSRSNAQKGLDTAKREQQKLLAQVDEQDRQLRSALQTQRQREETSRNAHAELKDELDRLRTSLKDVRAENDRLARKANRNAKQASDLRIESDAVLEQRERDLQERLENQREEFSIRTQNALDEREVDFAAEKDQLICSLREEEAGRQLVEQELAIAEHALVAAEDNLEKVSEALDNGARQFGYIFPDRQSLEERVRKLADKGMPHVSRYYRVPIEHLCSALDIGLDGWPDKGHPEYFAKLATTLDNAVEEIKLKFRDQQVSLQKERAHWLELFKSSLKEAGDDVRFLESALESNEQRATDLEQYFGRLDGEGGIIETFMNGSKRARWVIAEQKRRMALLEKDLATTSAQCAEFAQVLEAIMNLEQ
ncbi:hypothetical protein EKO04_010984 [Ascochyta lentis]|uniref:Uncharacterized protein n=1 Tax=Ascochyta lentis TaxID=205686 RepID=A0A8H7MDQ0_9PLEO|nr:hypothetical protein EKO04_010984 [Ascochyta lentis]